MGIQRISISILMGISVIVLTGMGRVNKDLSNEPKYSSFIGKEYRTKIDLVIHRFDGSKKMSLSWYGHSVPEKEEMKDKFPFRYHSTKIHGILPARSIFKINRVKEEGSNTASFVYYYADIISSDNKEFLNKEINPSSLTFRANDPPDFKSKYVEEVIPETKK